MAKFVVFGQTNIGTSSDATFNSGEGYGSDGTMIVDSNGEAATGDFTQYGTSETLACGMSVSGSIDGIRL